MDPDSYLSSFVNLWSEVTVNTPTTGALVALILSVLLLVCSGFVSASEVAFFSLSPSDLNEIEDEDNVADKQIKALIKDSEYLLSTILISNNFINVTIIMLCNYFFSTVVNWGNAVVLEFIAITVILTFLLLLFGEIMPKIYSVQHTLSFCRTAAPVICVLRKVFYPFSTMLVRSSYFVNKYVSKRNYNLSVDDLSQALELTDKNEISEESNILEGIIRFGGETAKEVMTSRLDMVGLEINTSYEEVLRLIVDMAYSRIPVYAGNIDNIKGILYIKDLLPYLDKGKNFKWQTLVRQAFFVPETKMIDDLLRDFQTNRIHIAIVVDEFGGTSGIVTMEDIIEEIVGEINDEYDEEEKPYVLLPDGSYIFEGKTQLTDFFKIMKTEDDVFEEIEGEADTLAGLILELKGDFPKPHEVFTYQEYVFEVLEMELRRIVKIKVTVNPSCS